MQINHLVQASSNFMIAIFLICIAIALLLKPWKQEVWRYWAVALLFTLGGLAALVHTINTAGTEENLATARGEVIRSATEVKQVLEAKQIKATCIIPTGVQVQGFKFETSLDLEMHGYIWQTYPSSCATELRGFTVPEAYDGGFNRQEIKRHKNADDSETVLYQFSTTQRQLFNYDRYPFDYQTLWLRLWSIDFNGSAVLVPDFTSYPTWVDSEKFGIDQDAEIGGFALDFTRWSIFFPADKTSFGQIANDASSARVGLYYNVGFHRLLVGPTVNHILPVAVIILLTFAALMFVHTDESQATAILTFIGALLFAAIFNHQGIRSSVNASGYTVVGLYSIISYLLLILVTINVIIIAKTNIHWFEKHDNIFSKALFLPLTAWALALVTHFSLLLA